MPFVSCQLKIKSKRITQNFKRTVRHHHSYDPLLQYIKNKNNWTDYHINLTGWDLGHRLNKAHTRSSITTSKQLYNNLPTNQRLFKIQQYLTPFCNCCKNVKETNYHIIFCNHSNNWNWGLQEKLITIASRNKTDINLITVIVDGINARRNRTNLLNQFRYPEHCQFFVDDTNVIGKST